MTENGTTDNGTTENGTTDNGMTDNGTTESAMQSSATTEDTDATRPSRIMRAPIIVVLLTALGAAIFVGNAASPEPRAVETPTDPVALPPAGARSVAWYCAGGPLSLTSTDEGDQLAIGDEGLRVANTTPEAQVVRISVMFEAEIVSTSEREIPASSVRSIPVRELTDAIRPGIVVEAFSDGVVVEHIVRGSGVAVGPCATEPSSTWFLPSGRTVEGTLQFLTLFNPFGDDAVVDVAFDTREERREPEVLRGFVVPRRSRRTILVHQEILREELVATTIVARTGRIVASQTLEVESGGTGTSDSLGAVAAAPEWTLAGGRAADGVTRTLVVMNPGDVDVEVDVQVLTDDGSIVEPITVSVPRRSSVDLDMSAVVEAGVGYALLVSSASDRGIVVGDVVRWDEAEIDGLTLNGIATTLGSSRAATRWLFATTEVDRDSDVDLFVANAGVVTATVGIELVGADAPTLPSGASEVEIPGGAVVRIRVPRSDATAAIIVTADEPVTVERRLVAADGTVSLAPGVPPTPEVAPAGTTTTEPPTTTSTTTTTVAPTTTTTVPATTRSSTSTSSTSSTSTSSTSTSSTSTSSTSSPSAGSTTTAAGSTTSAP